MYEILTRLDCLMQVIPILDTNSAVGTIIYVLLGWAEC